MKKENPRKKNVYITFVIETGPTELYRNKDLLNNATKQLRNSGL